MKAAQAGEVVPNRGFITAAIMLACLMQSLDTTIANVALPHMLGSLQGSQEQITWVLTSYIVAAAIVTPLIPWLSERIGRKPVLMISISGFSAASLLCGIAINMPQIVAFRFLQGVFGAALVPLAQSVVLDINPPEKHGQAMSTFILAAILGPIVGPALGGFLTDNYNWRWVFLINLPGGILAFLGIWLFMPKDDRKDQHRFDFFGYGTLAIGIAALQLMLDRGQSKDWFDSPEIWAEMLVAAGCAYLFVIHTMTTTRPFFDPGLAKDRNFVAACFASFFVLSMLFAVLALLPPLLEQLMGYPVLTTGLVTMPRGVGMFITMLLVGRLMGKVDSRLMVAIGVLISAFSLFGMSGFSLQMGFWPIIWTGFMQGAAIGFIFVPLSSIAFLTLPAHLRTEGSAVFNLTRNIGSAVGISAMQAILISNQARARSTLIEHIRPDNPLIQQMRAPFNLSSDLGIAMLNGLVSRQGGMVAYANNFRIMAIATLLVLPVLLVLRKPPGPAPKIDVHLD